MGKLKEYIQILLSAVIIATFIIAFVAQTYVVEGASMEPTLHNGERILTEKVSYRFKDPQRGDIIVLKSPSVRPYVKRVIGIAGDEVLIRDKKLYINGECIEERYIKEATLGDWGPYVVPEGKVFVLGDNRNNSNDSRRSVGYLDIKDIKGKAILVFFPFNSTKLL